MSNLQSIEQKRRWTEVHDMLQDLIVNPGALDAKTDIFYAMIWDDKP